MATKKAVQETQQEGATQEEEWKLPLGYESVSVGFRRAFEHAKRHGNSDKASLLFAEAHYDHFEETGEHDA